MTSDVYRKFYLFKRNSKNVNTNLVYKNLVDISNNNSNIVKYFYTFPI